ncbi:MAG: PEP-CTERM sorting domain-containing protein [Planctomycetota bacterium]
MRYMHASYAPAVFALACVASSAQAVGLVDGFSDLTYSFDGTPSIDALTDTTLLPPGATRVVTVTDPTVTSVVFSNSPSGIAIDTGIAATVVELEYQLTWPIDLSPFTTGTNFSIDAILVDDSIEVDFTLTLIDSSANSATNSQSLVTSAPTAVVFDELSAFSSSSSFDFSEIEEVRLTLETSAGDDFVIDNFQIIPEPATLTLLSLGLGLCIRRRP